MMALYVLSVPIDSILRMDNVLKYKINARLMMLRVDNVIHAMLDIIKLRMDAYHWILYVLVLIRKDNVLNVMRIMLVLMEFVDRRNMFRVWVLVM